MFFMNINIFYPYNKRLLLFRVDTKRIAILKNICDGIEEGLGDLLIPNRGDIEWLTNFADRN